MSNISVLHIAEGVDIAQRRIAEIEAELGHSAAHSLIGSALEQMALTLQSAAQAAQRDELAQVTTHADRLSRLAWQIGLISLAIVAVDVGRCAESRDLRALSATLARLQRVAGRSLMQVWDRSPDDAG